MSSQRSRRIAFLIASVFTVFGVVMQWPMHRFLAAPAWGALYVVDAIAGSPELWRHFGAIIAFATVTNVLSWWAILFVILRITRYILITFRAGSNNERLR